MGLWEQRFQNAKKIPKTHERRWFKLLGGLCRNENYLNYKYTVVSSLEAADSALEQKRSQKLHLSHIAHYVINVQTIHILYILFILSILLIVVLFHLIYCSFYLLNNFHLMYLIHVTLAVAAGSVPEASLFKMEDTLLAVKQAVSLRVSTMDQYCRRQLSYQVEIGGRYRINGLIFTLIFSWHCE